MYTRTSFLHPRVAPWTRVTWRWWCGCCHRQYRWRVGCAESLVGRIGKSWMPMTGWRCRRGRVSLRLRWCWGLRFWRFVCRVEMTASPVPSPTASGAPPATEHGGRERPRGALRGRASGARHMAPNTRGTAVPHQPPCISTRPRPRFAVHRNAQVLCGAARYGRDTPQRQRWTSEWDNNARFRWRVLSRVRRRRPNAALI